MNIKTLPNISLFVMKGWKVRVVVTDGNRGFKILNPIPLNLPTDGIEEFKGWLEEVAFQDSENPELRFQCASIFFHSHRKLPLRTKGRETIDVPIRLKLAPFRAFADIETLDLSELDTTGKIWVVHSIGVAELFRTALEKFNMGTVAEFEIERDRFIEELKNG